MRVIAQHIDEETVVAVTEEEWRRFAAAFDDCACAEPMTINITDQKKLHANSFAWVRDWLRSSTSVVRITTKAEYESLVILADKMYLQMLREELEMWYLANILSVRNVALFLNVEDDNLAHYTSTRLSGRFHLSDLTPADDYLFATQHNLDTVADALTGLVGPDLNGNPDASAKAGFLTSLVEGQQYVCGRLMLDIFARQ